MTLSVDQQLARLLATPDRPADDTFVARTEALISFDTHRRASRRAAFIPVGLETAAGVAMLATFAGAAQIGEAAPIVPLASPAMAGLVALALWCAVSLAGSQRRRTLG